MNALFWERLNHSRTTVLGLLLLLVVAFALRWWNIEGNGLWIDEIATTQCLAFDLTNLLDCRRAELGSPLPHVATNLVYTIFGRPAFPIPEWLVRLPAVLAGTFAVLAAWLAAKQALGVRGAWLAALLWTVSPVAVANSQEARMYAWLMLFSNASAWLLFVMLRTREWKWGIAFGIAAALNFYSHYLAVFVLAGQFAFAFLYAFSHYKLPGARKLIRALLVASVVSSALILPWMPFVLRASEVHLFSSFYTRAALTLTYALNAQAWLALNRIEVPLGALVIALIEVLGIVWLWRQRRATLALLAVWLAAPCAYLLVRQAGFTTMRYWTVILPPLYWLVTAGALWIAEQVEKIFAQKNSQLAPRVSYLLVACVGIVALAPSLARTYVEPHESWRFTDWRGAAKLLRAQAKANDVVIVFGEASIYHKLAFDFYLPPNAATPRVIEPNELDGALATQMQNTHARAWGMVYARDAQEIERVRAVSDAMDVTFVKNLALISPRPLSNQETARDNALRLLNAFRAWDVERFAVTEIMLRDTGQGKNVLVNPNLETRKDGSPRAWMFAAVRGKILKDANEPMLALASPTEDGTTVAQQFLELQPEHYYVFRYECRNTLARGAQRTYVTFDRFDNTLQVFPNGAGDVCANNADWRATAFVVHVPAATQAKPRAAVILRNAGIGDAFWRRMSVYEIDAP